MEEIKILRFGLIRHGITDWNVARKAQGQTDIPLNTQGKEQAKALAHRMRNDGWDVIYASDLSRAKETADTVAEQIGKQVILDPRLREMHCGQIEGTTEEERRARWGDDWRSLDLGLESHESIAERGLAFFHDVSQTHLRDMNRNILVVSHGALLGITLQKLVPHVNTEEHLLNTSVTILTFANDRWDCELYNCAAHLRPA